MPEFLRALPLAAWGPALYMHSRASGGPIRLPQPRDVELAADRSFILEMRAALQGVIALVGGKRDAVQHFDVSQAGLVGSFIALLLSTGICAGLPVLLGTARANGSVFEFAVSIALLLAFQIIATAVFLRSLGLQDRLIAYVIVDNWASFFVLLGSLSLIIMGAPQGLMAIAALVIGVLVLVNIGRVIIGLSPMRVAMFIAVQMVANLAGYAMFFSMFPPDPASVSSLQL